MQSASYSSAKRNLSSLFVVSLILIASLPAWAQVKPGDFITPAHADKVKDLVSPGEYWRLAQRGEGGVVAAGPADWPPPHQDDPQHGSAAGAPRTHQLRNCLPGCIGSNTP